MCWEHYYQCKYHTEKEVYKLKDEEKKKTKMCENPDSKHIEVRGFNESAWMVLGRFKPCPYYDPDEDTCLCWDYSTGSYLGFQAVAVPTNARIACDHCAVIDDIEYRPSEADFLRENFDKEQQNWFHRNSDTLEAFEKDKINKGARDLTPQPERDGARRKADFRHQSKGSARFSAEDRILEQWGKENAAQERERVEREMREESEGSQPLFDNVHTWLSRTRSKSPQAEDTPSPASTGKVRSSATSTAAKGGRESRSRSRRSDKTRSQANENRVTPSRHSARSGSRHTVRSRGGGISSTDESRSGISKGKAPATSPSKKT